MSISEDSGTAVIGDSFRVLSATSTGAVIRNVTGVCGKTTGSITGAGGEGVVAWGGGGGGGGDEGGESIVVDSAMTAGNGTMGGGGDVTVVVVVSRGLDVT